MLDILPAKATETPAAKTTASKAVPKFVELVDSIPTKSTETTLSKSAKSSSNPFDVGALVELTRKHAAAMQAAAETLSNSKHGKEARLKSSPPSPDIRRVLASAQLGSTLLRASLDSTRDMRQMEEVTGDSSKESTDSAVPPAPVATPDTNDDTSTFDTSQMLLMGVGAAMVVVLVLCFYAYSKCVERKVKAEEEEAQQHGSHALRTGWSPAAISTGSRQRLLDATVHGDDVELADRTAWDDWDGDEGRLDSSEGVSQSAPLLQTSRGVGLQGASNHGSSGSIDKLSTRTTLSSRPESRAISPAVPAGAIMGTLGLSTSGPSPARQAPAPTRAASGSNSATSVPRTQNVDLFAALGVEASPRGYKQRPAAVSASEAAEQVPVGHSLARRVKPASSGAMSGALAEVGDAEVGQAWEEELDLGGLSD